MWEGALKCLFRFLLWSEVTNGLNFILAAGASAMATEGAEFVFLTRSWMLLLLLAQGTYPVGLGTPVI